MAEAEKQKGEAMSKAALVLPGIGMDAGARCAGLEIGFILAKIGSYEFNILSKLYPESKLFGDPVNFPYRCTEELAADVWLTSNALGALFQYKKTPKGYRPNAIVARVHTLEELPALTGAYRDAGLDVEWTSEAIWEHGTPIQRHQIFLVARKGYAELEFGTAVKTTELEGDWYDNPKWIGPIDLDPVATSDHDMAIISRLREGTVAKALAAVLKNMSGSMLQDYDPDEAFASYVQDGDREILAKLTDGGVQKLLDGSMEQFFSVWPENGVLAADGGLLGFPRTYRGSIAWLPAFWNSRNARYIALALGVTDVWIEKEEVKANPPTPKDLQDEANQMLGRK